MGCDFAQWRAHLLIRLMLRNILLRSMLQQVAPKVQQLLRSLLHKPMQ
jgi:hypothetical protein